MLKLPPQGHPASEMFDVEHLADFIERGEYVTFQSARHEALRTIARGAGLISSVVSLVLRGDDALELAEFSARDAQVLWRFGQV